MGRETPWPPLRRHLLIPNLVFIGLCGRIEKPTGLGPNAASNYKTHEWPRGISRPCKFIDLILSEAGGIPRATIPAPSARAFLAHPTRFERLTDAFGALLHPTYAFALCRKCFRCICVNAIE
jgi:hypothetical protein